MIERIYYIVIIKTRLNFRTRIYNPASVIYMRVVRAASIYFMCDYVILLSLYNISFFALLLHRFLNHVKNARNTAAEHP